MLVSPGYFVEEQSVKSYAELLLIRDEIIQSIYSFEQCPSPDSDFDPGPDVIYQWNLECLGKLCDLIAEKYRQEVVWGNTDPELEETRIAAFLMQHQGEYISSYRLVEKSGAYIGDLKKLEMNQLFKLDEMVSEIAEKYGFSLDMSHHDGREEGVLWHLDFRIDKK